MGAAWGASENGYQQQKDQNGRDEGDSGLVEGRLFRPPFHELHIVLPHLRRAARHTLWTANGIRRAQYPIARGEAMAAADRGRHFHIGVIARGPGRGDEDCPLALSLIRTWQSERQPRNGGGHGERW